MTVPNGQALHAEVEALGRRLRLPYLRKAVVDVLPTAKAQRWDPADVVRVLLEEEAQARDAATIATAVDLFMHHAHVVVTDGGSYRLAQARNGTAVTPLARTHAGRTGVHTRGEPVATSGDSS